MIEASGSWTRPEGLHAAPAGLPEFDIDASPRNVYVSTLAPYRNLSVSYEIDNVTYMCHYGTRG